jgi:hypothetical protein
MQEKSGKIHQDSHVTGGFFSKQSLFSQAAFLTIVIVIDSSDSRNKLSGEGFSKHFQN